MLKYKNLFLRPELFGFPGFKLVPKLRCDASCLPPCLSSVGLTGRRGLHSHIQFGNKVFRDRGFSSSVLEVMDNNSSSNNNNNTILEENSNNLHLPSAYNAAMEALSSLISTRRGRDGNGVQRKHEKLERMRMYVKILGLEEQIAGLKIIHVAGTKGKGSTCAFCEAVLRECGLRTGLFTSPHLIDVRERFRLNGMDISEEKFLHYFWECWHQLEKNLTDGLPMPPLFQFLTVLAFKIFAHEKVDVAIIEVGLGGSRDSTNVINTPVVCGIASLGMDHMETLGDTLEMIAAHKAGIFKPRVPAFTVPQLSEAMGVLHEKAKENKVPLEVIAPLDSAKLQGKQLSLSGDHQFTNAGLAVALCRSWLQSTGNWEKLYGHADKEQDLPEAFRRGLSTARLSGRAQIVYDCYPTNSSGELIFYLDGAHSPESLDACARWFSEAVKEVQNQPCNNGYIGPAKDELGKITKQILLFNCMDVRDPKSLLPALVDTCAASGTHFAKAIFAPSISTYNKVTSSYSTIPPENPSRDLSWQFNLQTIWEKIIHGNDGSCKNSEMQIPEATPPHRFVDEDACNCNPADGHFACSAVVSSLPMTINWLRSYVKENPSYRIQVLVTGSLHLVGDVLKLLRR